MSLKCIVERDGQSQNDVVPDRPAGSSCCTLFCSRVALSVLASSCESSLTMPALKALLQQAVCDWDKKRLVGRGRLAVITRQSSARTLGVRVSWCEDATARVRVDSSIQRATTSEPHSSIVDTTLL